MIRLSDYLMRTYGEKVYRLSLSSGCTCPNRDGRIMTGGCTFCSEGGAGEFASPLLPLGDQIEEAKKRISRKTKAGKYIAYFQSFSNTYGDPARLFPLYSEALRREEIIALSLGTRPDCIPEEILGMLIELNREKPVWIELGLQTVHERSAERIRRGYPLSVFEDCYRRLKAAGITVIVHVIFGLPGESREDMLETARYLAGLRPELDGIKIHLLQILSGTAMAEEYRREPFPLLSLEEYTSLVRESIKILPKDTVLHRMTGDGPKKLLIAPLWCADKKRVLNYMNRELASVLP